jgi:hypothetical protein
MGNKGIGQEPVEDDRVGGKDPYKVVPSVKQRRVFQT